MQGRAIFSDDQRYRYMLSRLWDPLKSNVVFILLNPSTADAEANDPTVRRCIGYARDWGHGGLYVLNLYALRSTDPKALKTDPDPVGPLNDFYIRNVIWRQVGILRLETPVVCGWGAQGDSNRQAKVLNLLKVIGVKPLCLGTTNTGMPRHPLYLPKDLKPSELP